MRGAVRVLDPACGEGALLLAAAGVLGERARLEGWEKDRSALREARRGLLARRIKARIVHRDALASERPGEYDAILANPPWVSFSGRESVAIDARERARLRERFETFRGWPQLQGPFLERALGLVREGGRVGFVLPRQVLELERYAPIRAVVREQARVLEVRDLGEDVFEGVCEPAATIVLEKQSRREPPAAGEPLEGAGAPLPRWALRALARLERFQRFPRELLSDPGVHTGNAAKLVLAAEPRAGFVPCREGKDVLRYELLPPRLHVWREPRLEAPLYARVRPLERYRETAIVVRQTANRPIAARHAPWAHFRNSVLAVRCGPYPPELLLALLNSRLLALAHRARFADARQRAFPQVKIGALARLPFAPRASEALVRLVRLRERGAPVEPAIERAVAAIFGLGEDETLVPALFEWLP